MNKIEEFLSANKGCPMTPSATKQLLIKFIESLSDEGLGELLDIVKAENANKFIAINASGKVDAMLPSSLDLLSTAVADTDQTGKLFSIFSLTEETFSKITSKTILIYTFGNCFVLGMVGLTGEGRVCGNLIYNDIGDSKLCKVKFKIGYENYTHVVKIETDLINEMSTPFGAYLYAFSVK